MRPSEWVIVGDNTTRWLEDTVLPPFTKVLECSDIRQATKKNLAIDKSSAEYIVVIDSDQEAQPGLVEQCVKKAKQGYRAVTIPEVFQKPTSYLQKCYYFVRTVYAQNVEGIPRFFRREDMLEEKFNVDFHYAEDPELWSRLKVRTGEPAVIEDNLVHKEKFSLLYNSKKVRMAAKAQRRMKVGSTNAPKRVSVGKMLKEAPLVLLPGVLIILMLRIIARRIP